MRKDRAFTLIELSVIILILALLAAAVVPRLVVVQRSVEARVSMDGVQRLAARARETAMTSGRPVDLAFDESEHRFQLRLTNDEGDSEVGSSIPLHPDILPQSFRAGPNEPSASDWTVSFYPDGTSDGGAVETSEGGIVRTFVIGSKSGLTRWQDGAMPANETDRWQAGEYERRG